MLVRRRAAASSSARATARERRAACGRRQLRAANPRIEKKADAPNRSALYLARNAGHNDFDRWTHEGKENCRSHSQRRRVFARPLHGDDSRAKAVSVFEELLRCSDCYV